MLNFVETHGGRAKRRRDLQTLRINDRRRKAGINE